MNVIISDECLKQLNVIEYLKNKENKDYEKLYMRIALCVKALESVDCIDDIPFELRFHKGNSNQKGHLKKPLENCLSVDLDGTTRFLTFEKKGNAIVVTSLGHYDISLGKDDLGEEITLLKSSEESVSDLDELLDDDNFYSSLKKESEQAKQLLLDSVKGVELTDTIIHSFDSNVTKDVCPLSPDAVKCRITSALGAWEKQYKQEKNISKIPFEDSQIRDDKVKELVEAYAVSSDNHTSLLERSIVNARGLSNAGAIVCGDKDPNKLAELKIMLDECWVKHFSNLVYYVNTKVSSVAVKKDLFNKMGNALINSFDKKYDGIVEVDIEELRKLDENLRKAVFEDLKKAVIEDINNILELKDVTKYEQIIKNTNQQSIFGRLFPKFTVAVQNLKSFFSSKGQTNEADNSVESVAFPKEQEENITKKEIAESQENQSLNNQEQSLSLSLERRKYMNRIQLKPEASNEETQKSDRMKMMQSNSNKERNNACDNVISTSQKKGRSR